MMTSYIPDQIAAITQAHLAAQQGSCTALSNKIFQNATKLVDLNMQAIKDAMSQSIAITQQILSAKTPQEFLSLAGSQAQPNIERVLTYGRTVAAIASKAQTELGEAVQAQMGENKQTMAKSVEGITRDTPSGFENFYEMTRSAVENAGKLYGQWASSTEKAVETMQANFSLATGQFAQNTKKAAGHAKRANG